MSTTTLRIELCGRLADACGREVELDLPDSGLPVAALMTALGDAYPALGEALGRGRIRACVNEAIVPVATVVRASDQVALFPPVSGG